MAYNMRYMVESHKSFGNNGHTTLELNEWAMLWPEMFTMRKKKKNIFLPCSLPRSSMDATPNNIKLTQ